MFILFWYLLIAFIMSGYMWSYFYHGYFMITGISFQDRVLISIFSLCWPAPLVIMILENHFRYGWMFPFSNPKNLE